MDFKIIWTESACEDLGAIVRYLTHHANPETAKSIGFGIYNRVQLLATHPQVGPILPEKNDPRWRKLIFKSWKIAYQIDFQAHIIYIARVWHAAQNEIEF